LETKPIVDREELDPTCCELALPSTLSQSKGGFLEQRVQLIIE